MQIDNNYILIVIGITAVAVELFLGVAAGFDLVLIGAILIIAGIIGVLLNSFSFALALIAVMALLYVFIGRAFVKSKFNIQTKATNVDALIGKKAIVARKITSNKPGQVSIEGEIWRAELSSSEPGPEEGIDEGEKVTVESVSGVTLKVTK